MNRKKVGLLIISALTIFGIAFGIVEGTKKPRQVMPPNGETELIEETIRSANVMVTSTNVTIDGTSVKHGSGVVISEEVIEDETYYLVVTNYHVVHYTSGVNLIKVTDINNVIYEAHIAPGSINESIDLVLIRIKKTSELVTINVNAASSVNSGELAVAIGFNQQEYKVNYGTVDQVTNSTIIHNAQSYPGFSGGGLYNAALQLIGINVQIITETETNKWIRSIAIPISVLRNYLEAYTNAN